MVERAVVVQELLGLFPSPAYLEIGVDAGDTFRSIQAGHKVAVDPEFKFVPPPPTEGVQYVPVTSDAYFAAHCPPSLRFDLVYIDGLHTAEQALRDLMNALLRLKPGGIVILDDVLPTSFHAAMPSLSEAFQVRDHLFPPQAGVVDNTWMGDVYKLVFFIKSFVQQMSYATVQENHGQLIMWHAPRPVNAVGHDTLRDIALLDFSATILSRTTFNIRPLADIMAEIRASRSPD